MGKFFTAVILVLLAAAGALWWWVQDANRLKPQLEQYLSTTLEMPVRIGGDVSWQLWPPLYVTAAELSAHDDDSRYHVRELQLAVSFADLFGNPADWRVDSLIMTDVQQHADGDLTTFDSVQLTGYAPGAWAELRARGNSGGTTLSIAGEVRQLPVDVLTVEFRALAVSAADTRMVCEGQVADSGADELPATAADALLPIDTLLGWRWTASCGIPQMALNGQTFANLRLETSHDAGQMRSVLTVPDFFTGTAAFELHTDLTGPVTWKLQPALEGVAPEPLMAWLGRPLRWQGALRAQGTAEASGTGVERIISSLRVDLGFDGGEGQIDISEIKRQVAALAQHSKQASSVDKWPDTWRYTYLVGAWRADGNAHRLDLALDNLTVMADGTYDPTSDALDMQASLTFGDDPAYSRFDVNPLLVGLPIPAHCRGSLAQPTCRLDDAQALKNVGRALAGGDGSALKSKLAEKIDEEVPEQYRDAARTLLDILSGALDEQDR